MKNKLLLTTAAVVFVALSSLAQVTGTFTDSRDGKVYKTVTIGTQTWLAENLAYKVKNGCWAYNDDIANVTTYGYLYNWETAQKACPKGWRLPTYAEWTTLIDYLGGESVAGDKMKSETGWKDSGNGTNTSGFSALPGGNRSGDGYFGSVGSFGYWWNSSEKSDDLDAWHFYMYYNSKNVSTTRYNKTRGFSVRCIKVNSDQKTTSIIQNNTDTINRTELSSSKLNISTGSFTDSRDSKEYKTVTIGEQTWMAENLAFNTANGCWKFKEEEFSTESWYYYNWETAKNVCPTGWHLPSDEEWSILVNNLGGELKAGLKLQAKGYSATNESGFSAYLSGFYRGNIYVFKQYGFWWSSTEDNTYEAWTRRMYVNNGFVSRLGTNKETNGNSVRCVKD